MYSRLSRLLGVVGCVAFTACAPADQTPAADQASEPAAAAEPAPITQQEVDAFSSTVNGYIRDGDTASLHNVYTDDAIMVSARGKTEGGQALVEFWKASVQAGQGKTLSGETVKFGSNGELAWQLSRFTGGVTAPSGHSLRVFQRQPDGGLRVVVQVAVPDAPAQQ
jgi:ketosteroid isomerase-like protein